MFFLYLKILLICIYKCNKQNNNNHLFAERCTEYDPKIKHVPFAPYQYIHGMQIFSIVHFEMKYIELQISN